MVNYMLCVDGSDDSEMAFLYMLKVLKPEDSLWLFSSFAAPTELLTDVFQLSTDALVVANRDDYEKELASRKNDAHALMHDLLTRLKQHQNVTMANVQYEVVQADDVRPAIITFAETHSIETIVMGTRGLGKIAKLLLGSVSSYVIEHAHCSVLVVR